MAYPLIKRIFVYGMWTTGICLLLIAVTILVCHLLVVFNAKGRLYTSTTLIPKRKVGLLLGTTPVTRIGRRTNAFYFNRIDAAEQLYKAGKIETIYISGDGNSLDGINEVECMRNSLVKRGIPDSAIMLDPQGLRTINSVEHLVRDCHTQTFTVISQRFHNERSLYLAEHLGFDVHDLIAYNAADSHSRTAIITYAREYLARVKMFMDIIFY